MGLRRGNPHDNLSVLTYLLTGLFCSFHFSFFYSIFSYFFVLFINWEGFSPPILWGDMSPSPLFPSPVLLDVIWCKFMTLRNPVATALKLLSLGKPEKYSEKIKCFYIIGVNAQWFYFFIRWANVYPFSPYQQKTSTLLSKWAEVLQKISKFGQKSRKKGKSFTVFRNNHSVSRCFVNVTYKV